MEPERRELLDRWKLTYDPAVRYAWQKLDEIRNLCLNEILQRKKRDFAFDCLDFHASST